MTKLFGFFLTVLLTSSVGFASESEAVFKKAKDQPFARDFRPVLPGIMYRGGSNASMATKKNSPMNDKQLQALCDLGFDEAIFFYAMSPRPDFKCANGRKLKYHRMGWSNQTSIQQVHRQVHQALNRGGKLMIHCYNGVHATGISAATALIQFCGFSHEKALEYVWIGMMDKSPAAKIRELILNFKPQNLPITDAQRAAICPN